VFCQAIHIPLRLQEQKHRSKNILVPAIFDVRICDFMVLLISLPLHILPKREIHGELQTTKLFLIFIPDIFSLLEYEPYVHTLVHFILKQVSEITLKLFGQVHGTSQTIVSEKVYNTPQILM
jgi:hypothetical protein